jgi:hypothetical protein
MKTRITTIANDETRRIARARQPLATLASMAAGLVLAVVALLSPVSAFAYFTDNRYPGNAIDYIEICNRGDLDVDMVIAHQGSSTWSSNTAFGWIPILKGRCFRLPDNFMRYGTSGPSYLLNFGLAFKPHGEDAAIVLDSRSRQDIVYDDGTLLGTRIQGDELQNRSRFACVDTQSPRGFNTTFNNWSATSNCRSGMLRMPIATWVLPRAAYSHTDVTINIYPNNSNSYAFNTGSSTQNTAGTSDDLGSVLVGVAAAGALWCIIVGNCFDSDEDGVETIEYSSGSVYEGQGYRNDQGRWVSHGYGKRTVPNGYLGDSDFVGYTDEGLFEDGELVTGKSTLNNGVILEGEFFDGGFMKRTYPDGSYYEGVFVDNKLQGFGTWVDSEGTSSYEGEWVDGLRMGKGTRTVDGSIAYVGEFVDDLYHGQGIEYSGDDETYEGQFANGVREGQGRIDYGGGVTFEGEFRQGAPNGQGKFTGPGGANFEGVFENGVASGPGMMTLADGSQCSGEWQRNELVGVGEGIQDGRSAPCYGTDAFLFTFEEQN